MTEPSDEARNLARRIRNELGGEPFLSLKEAAEEIDTLTEQRVAAALEPWEQLRVACADILGYDTDWPQHGNAPLAIAAALRLRVNAHRPAPEGAASTKDGDTNRRSAPSQEDTGSVSGERWRHKKRGATYTIVGIANSQVVGEPIREATQAVVYRSEDDGSLWLRRRDEFYDGRFERLPPTDAGGPGSASNTDVAQGRFMGAGPWPTGEYYVWDKEKASICNPDAGDSSIPYRHLSSLEEANTAANALNRGVVAAPGPTAGDAKTEINRRVQARYGALMHEGKHGHYETMFNIVHGERASARAELLAQIREPSEELVEETAKAAAETEDPGSWTRLAETNLRLCKHDYREMQRSALRALADKLTESDRCSIDKNAINAGR